MNKNEKINWFAVVTLFILAVFLVSLRTEFFFPLFGKDSFLGEFWHSMGARSLRDFEINIYYPIVAFLHGENPYNWATQVHHYPVTNALPPYLPYIILIHLPFGFLSVLNAKVFYYFFSIALIPIVATLTLRMVYHRSPINAVLVLSALSILTRPGQLNLLYGHLTLQVVLGTYLALFFARTHPIYSGLGLALSMMKPSFGVPLAVLMLANKNGKPVLFSFGIAALATLSVLPFLIVAEGGLLSFVQVMIASYHSWTNIKSVVPSGSVSIDLPSLVSRLSGTPFSYGQIVFLFLVLGLSSFAIWYVSRYKNKQAEHLTLSIICIAILIGIYHQPYDLLLLMYPFVLLVCNFEAISGFISSKLRWVMIILFFILSFNFISSLSFLNSSQITGNLRTLLVNTNGFAICLLLLIYLFSVFFPADKEKIYTIS